MRFTNKRTSDAARDLSVPEPLDFHDVKFVFVNGASVTTSGCGRRTCNLRARGNIDRKSSDENVYLDNFIDRNRKSSNRNVLLIQAFRKIRWSHIEHMRCTKTRKRFMPPIETSHAFFGTQTLFVSPFEAVTKFFVVYKSLVRRLYREIRFVLADGRVAM
jgi:hypothetical protein